MLSQILVPEAILAALDGVIAEKEAANDSRSAVGFSNRSLAKAYLRYLLFTNWPKLLGSDAPSDEIQLLYNRYFWFTKFASIYTSVNGRDAGLEQQAFQMLEASMADIDWDVIAEIEKRTQEDAAAT